LPADAAVVDALRFLAGLTETQRQAILEALRRADRP
jgi:hypothetical protein